MIRPSFRLDIDVDVEVVPLFTCVGPFHVRLEETKCKRVTRNCVKLNFFNLSEVIVLLM